LTAPSKYRIRIGYVKMMRTQATLNLLLRS